MLLSLEAVGVGTTVVGVVDEVTAAEDEVEDEVIVLLLDAVEVVVVWPVVAL